MTTQAFNVWVEVEQVDVVDGVDMLYEDRSDLLEYGKVGRFATLDEALRFGNRLANLAEYLIDNHREMEGGS